ncbi:MAG: hypothetical protein AWU57_8 [Marinobacter sp. T13-3]|nr:MAG: hypothetical protein AWU57_8 [Marinobacter sp. T13-3]
MRLKIPSIAKPDPQMSADALKRITQKASTEKQLNPDKVTAADDKAAQGDKNQLSSKLETASTALGVVGTVAPHPMVKAVCMAGSTAATVGATVTEKLGIGADSNSPEVDQSAQLKGIAESAPNAKPWGSVDQTIALQNQMGGSDVMDVAQSIPGSAGGVNPQMLEQLREAGYDVVQRGPDLA